jgi:multidrug efflux pump subunit AcrA (membrane-fusion protein)
MEIAPQDDDLVVQAQISPVDADIIRVGQEAEIRLTALNVRTTPTIYGTVVSVSGDALTDSDNRTKFFLSQIEIAQNELVKLGDVKLSAGMPAEVLIQAGERTLLNYLVKPMSDALMRGLNEE